MSHLINICPYLHYMSLVFTIGHLWLWYVTIYHIWSLNVTYDQHVTSDSHMFTICYLCSPYAISGWHMYIICHLCSLYDTCVQHRSSLIEIGSPHVTYVYILHMFTICHLCLRYIHHTCHLCSLYVISGWNMIHHMLPMFIICQLCSPIHTCSLYVIIVQRMFIIYHIC